MTDTLQQVADDLASRLGEMRVVMDEMARALKNASHALQGLEDCGVRTRCSSCDALFRHGLKRADSALSAYERVRKLYSIETAPTEVRKHAGDVS